MTTLETIRVDAPDSRATVVLVHGAWHGAWCWQDGFAQRLATRGISTISPSLRGHAGSAEGVRINRMCMRDYVDDVVDIVARVTHEFGTIPFVAGHSMGGGVVQGLLSRPHPPRIAGAALLASMPPTGIRRLVLDIAKHTPGAFLLSNLTLDTGRLVRTPEQVRAHFFLPSTPDHIVEATTARLQPESLRAFVMDLLGLDRPKPQAVDMPMLVLGATEDAVFSPAMVAATAEAWGATPVMFDAIGHDVMLDTGWERIADELADWILQNAN
ncbi:MULTISPECIES: alpha/beta hydrolase [unclassified Rhodococcus (in: high G+C Gram-positive bacteria)]|uniref:alpha/beta hydrolase n=1 Tax=unclassified Rhodococcus (in: high G+C Gram-positive bacteria) TaxID=192944 RepID=UPI00163AF2B5|nr:MULTISPECIES: alpha/beta fold hydrolase [unclassified Rhodococcus (in: high G+C Gram-positive bacteria)]MBC2637912.1 alpha/beta fold hydrolase [Rhodococcus sp. 3A]MBC2897340.1 alpha/beta fold hydrolase [Rhodococcus sp. 4CII]